MPATEDVLCKFVAQVGFRHRTNKSYMAGVCHPHIEEGLGDPFLPALPQLHFIML